ALVVLVQVDRPVRRRQNGLVDCCLELLLTAGDIALHGLKALDQAPRVYEEAVREGRRRLRRCCTERRDRLEPLADDVVGGVLRSPGWESAGSGGNPHIRARG